ncbi:MAG: DUF4328 domain-containing protein [Vitreimonas sp.]
MTDSLADHVNGKLRDPTPLWSWLRGFIIFYIIAKLTSATIYGALALRGSAYDASSVADVPITLGILALAFLAPLSYLLCVILTLRVTYRTMKNLHLLQSSEVEMGPIFAVVSYFIPIVSLGAPVVGVGQIWRGTFAAVDPHRTDPGGRLGWWWGAFLLSGLLGAVSGALMQGGRRISDIINAAPYVAGAALVSVIAAILFWRVFAAIVKGQQRLIQIKEF